MTTSLSRRGALLVATALLVVACCPEDEPEPVAECTSADVYAVSDEAHECHWTWIDATAEARTWVRCLDFASYDECRGLSSAPYGAGDEFLDMTECACVGPERWEQ